MCKHADDDNDQVDDGIYKLDSFFINILYESKLTVIIIKTRIKLAKYFLKLTLCARPIFFFHYDFDSP